ncbi:MAG: DNA-directed RNA polymerase subunit K [Crenarchaeota archaeon]|nr:DNA-directed RNA polymerase subunit K [Thermoproteota archaeon]
MSSSKRIVTTVDDIVIGPKRLTKYERARIIAARALQLALGAYPLIDISELSTRDPVIIAERELEEGVLPILIRREKPNGEYQLIPVKVLVEHEKPLRDSRRELVKKLFRLES